MISKHLFGVASGILLALSFTVAYSGELYQWKDTAGIVHFTDNANKVPAEYRDKSARNVNALPVYGERAASASFSLDGQILWAERCSSCHHMGEGMDGDKVGLGRHLINQESKFPASVESVADAFQYAAAGRYSDMSRIDISKEELTAIARYFVDSAR